MGMHARQGPEELQSMRKVSPRSAPAPTAAAATAPRRQHSCQPALDTGPTRSSPVRRLERLFGQLCHAAEGAAPAGAPDCAGSTHGGAPCGQRHSLPQVMHSSGWEVQSSREQQSDVLRLAATVRQMCLQHDECADALVSAAAGMAGAPLQHLLVSAAGN